jgi:hypothetical protein
MFAAAKSCASQGFGCSMIDEVVLIVVSESVCDSREVDDGVALLQQRVPVER